MSTRAAVTLEEKVAFLSLPRSYPGRVRRVQRIETHFAWVFLTAKYAYKLKKPVRHHAMDYRSQAARKRGCIEEVRLNRRLAPKVYLSVVPLRLRGGSLRLGGATGCIEDWLVKMRQLPASGMLDSILGHRSLRAAERNRLVAHLGAFFAQAEAAPISSEAYVRRFRNELSANQRSLQKSGTRLNQALVQAVTHTQRTFLQRAGHRFGERGRCVVEGHGDLRAEHVYLGSPPCVIDCLEFSRNLRLFDPLEELAFLALEIERLGYPALAGELVRQFQLLRGHPAADAVISFYMSHRATTRAKLAIWHLDDPQFPDARPWIARANSYLRDALRHGRRALRLLAGGQDELSAHRLSPRNAAQNESASSVAREA